MTGKSFNSGNHIVNEILLCSKLSYLYFASNNLENFSNKYKIFNLFRAIAASAPVAQFTAPCDAFGRIVTADYSQQVNHF